MSETTFLTGPLDVGGSLATGLLQVRAVEIRPHAPFTWSSGWKSPIYCDNRIILGYPLLRDLVLQGFAAIVKTHFLGADVVAGTATAGIPHASMLADRLGLAGAYVRSSKKEHGKQKRVEGRVRAGDRVLVIEDTLSTGSSAFSAVDALREEGANVLAVLSIFSYDFPQARAKAGEAGVPVYRLLSYDTLIEVAKAHGYVSDADMAMLLAWRQDPEHFGAAMGR